MKQTSVLNGRATDVHLPDEQEQQGMTEAHEALASVLEQACSMDKLHSLGAITVRRDKKNGGFYAVAPVQTVIVGKSKKRH